MSGEQDRILDESARVSTLTTEELRQITLSQVMERLLRTRSRILPLGAVILAGIVALDPSPLKIAVLAALLLFFFSVVISDRLRLRRTPRFNKIDLLIIVVLQSGVVFLTGGIESPVLVAFVFAGFAAGLTLGRRAALWVVGAVTIVLWSMTLAGIYNVIPRTLPSFAGLEHGYLTDVRYAVTKALVINGLTLLTSRIGARLNDTFLMMISSAIDARQQALDTLVDRNRELVHLSSAIAHELKNPLASVQGLVQLLERGGANAEKRFEVLKQEIARMRTTLDAFLNLSRPLGELTIEKVSSEELLDDLTALHEGLAHAKSITVEPSGEKIDEIACDPRKMKQALTNLLQNAIEATPPGGRVSWIAHKNEQTIAIGVEDSGPGIKSDLIERATDVGVTTKAGGSGIGLAVARSIAEQHGGRLRLENRVGGGFSAVMELPR